MPTSADSPFDVAIAMQTPLRQHPCSSSFLTSTPLASAATMVNLFSLETPKEQIRPGYLVSGQGSYDWNCTPRASNESLGPFHELFGAHPAPAPPAPAVVASLTGASSSSSATATTLSQSKVRFVSMFGDEQMEQTTEEEISFTLSQDLDMEIGHHSSPGNLLQESPPVPACLSLSHHRCASANIPSRPPSISRRSNGSSSNSRRRCISVDTNGPIIDLHAPQFSQYRSPREVLHSSYGAVRRKRSIFDQQDEDREDRPLFSPCSASSETSGSRCTSATPTPASRVLASIVPQSLGSMFGSPTPSISMDSLALTQPSPSPPLSFSSPPPPLKRSKSVPPAPCPLALEDPVAAPPSSSLLPGTSSLFSPPRNSRGRSVSFTEDLALALPVCSSLLSPPPRTPPLVAEQRCEDHSGSVFTPISSPRPAPPAPASRAARGQ